MPFLCFHFGHQGALSFIKARMACKAPNITLGGPGQLGRAADVAQAFGGLQAPHAGVAPAVALPAGMRGPLAVFFPANSLQVDMIDEAYGCIHFTSINSPAGIPVGAIPGGMNVLSQAQRDAYMRA